MRNQLGIINHEISSTSRYHLHWVATSDHADFSESKTFIHSIVVLTIWGSDCSSSLITQVPPTSSLQHRAFPIEFSDVAIGGAQVVRRQIAVAATYHLAKRVRGWERKVDCICPSLDRGPRCPAQYPGCEFGLLRK